MSRISNQAHSKSQYHILLPMIVLIAVLGALSLPRSGLAEVGTDPVISLSSVNAPACSGDDAASCISASFKADLAHTASYVFNCSGDSIELPLLEWFLELLGVPLSLFEKFIIPDVPTPFCTLFAQGSILEITEGSPDGTYITLVEKTYYGEKHEDTFAVKANHTYEISLNAHGRDFRELLKSNNLGTFDSFAEVTYQEIDPNDESCGNALSFDLPYSGNLEFSGDHDWQRIMSPVSGTMVLTLDVPPDRDYQLEVRSDDCMTAWKLSNNGTGVDEQFVMPVDPGYYRVHVYGKTPNDFGSWYSVSALWDLDDNQWENAVPFDMPFSGNLEYSGDEDYQKINIPADGTTLVLDVPDGRDYDLELWRDNVKSLIAESKNGTGMDEYIPIALPGTYRIHIYGANPASDFNASYGVFIITDNIAPSSTAAFSGTVGDNGWYRSSVEVTLNAFDNPGGSGVQKIEYGFNYTPWIPFTGPWKVYTDPFTISTEGHTYLEFRSIDNAGNVEPNQSQVIRIDTVAPEISGVVFPPAPNPNGWYNTNVTVSFTASDFQSGIASLIPMETTLTNEGAGQSVTGTAIDNAGNSASLTMGNINIDKTAPVIAIVSPQATAYPRSASLNIAWNAVDNLSGIQTISAMLDSQPVINGQVIDLYTLSLGAHTMTLLAMDEADNTASLSMTFEVTADINSLLATADHAFELGWIEKEGVFASLNTSLKAAQASIERHQWTAARNQLMAVLNKLEAQKIKAINLQAYELLRADVIYVIAHLQ